MDSVCDALLIVNGIHRIPKCYAPALRMSRNCLFFHQVLHQDPGRHKCHHPQDDEQQPGPGLCW